MLERCFDFTFGEQLECVLLERLDEREEVPAVGVMSSAAAVMTMVESLDCDERLRSGPAGRSRCLWLAPPGDGQPYCHQAG